MNDESPGVGVHAHTTPVRLRVNGAIYEMPLEPRVSLLDALREFAGLTGSKLGCNQGACGACTVLVDGERILSCLSLAVQSEGREITTVEGLAEGGELHPLQAAFSEHDGFQCGYCTPGQLCSAIGMVREFRDGLPSAVSGDVGADGFDFSDEEIRERMSGNLCRCGAYRGICDAVRATFAEVLTGALLTLFATIFFIKDGRQIWTWLVRLFPTGSRERVAGAGERAWRTLISYVHATLAVALVDAIGIGVGAAILGVPLALPLGVIVFFGAFIPIVGAALSGLVAVLVALVALGPVKALILLVIVLLVQQVEGHILQPLLLGRAVKVHPLAIVFGIATGTLLAGIIGALLAVPIVAVIGTVSGYLSNGERDLVPTEPSGSDGGVPTG